MVASPLSEGHSSGLPERGDFPRAVRRARGRAGTRTTLLGVGILLTALFAALVLGGTTADTRAFVIDERTCYVANAPAHVATVRAEGRPLEMTTRTDENGFRIGSAADPSRGSAACRILATGDSFTHGDWVEGDDAYPAVLEASLRASGADVAVDNGGMAGHTIADERVAALGRWAALGHPIVMVAATANDLSDLMRLESLGCEIGTTPPSTFDLSVGDGADPSPITLAARSAVARVVSITAGLRLLGNHPAPSPVSTAEHERATELYLAELTRLATQLRARGVRLVFVLLEAPECPPVEGETHRPFPLDRVRAILALAGGLFVDATDALRAPGARLLPHDAHPSRIGHRAIAAAVADALATSGWLERCP